MGVFESSRRRGPGERPLPQRRYQAEQTGQQIAEIVGPEELYRRARENEELAALLVQVLELAERTGFEAKRRLLAMAAANAFQNDEAIDPAILVTYALSQLDTVHIRTLARLAALSDSHGAAPEEVNSDAARERAKEMAQAGEQVPLPVLVALANTGVVERTAMTFGGTLLQDVTPFGRQLLRDLQNADPDDETIRWVPPD